jgi:hypothetical protein
MGTTLICKIAMILLLPDDLKYLSPTACGRQGKQNFKTLNRVFKKVSSTQ